MREQRDRRTRIHTISLINILVSYYDLCMLDL